MLEKILATFPLPDSIYRKAIRKQLSNRLRQEKQKNITLSDYAKKLCEQNITICTEEANQQHYEIPTKFYDYVLGKQKKYSCTLWDEKTKNLDDSETLSLNVTCQRAQLDNQQNILELGCGWGAISLFMAEKFPQSQITAVSNSHTQKQYIEQKAKEKKISNLKILIQDIGKLQLDKNQFDRIVSVEMLEHVRNYKKLFANISQWLKDDGLFFVHIFGHKKLAYEFDDEEQKSWMAKYFFSGGQMPSKELFYHFNQHLKVKENWTIDGTHYHKTCEAWLNNMDKNKNKIIPLFQEHYNKDAKKFWLYWRLFFLACSELFNYQNGNEWQVYHYTFKKNLI